MKYIINYLSIIFLITPLSSLIAQTSIHNQGNYIVIGKNVSLESFSFTNETNAHLNNEGHLHLKGNMHQNATYVGSGTLYFEGETKQILQGDLVVNNLVVNNKNTLELKANQVEVLSLLDLSNTSSIALENTDLLIATDGAIKNYNSDHYILTNGSGSLRQSVGMNQKVVFPIGIDNYAPATLIDASEQTVYRLRVESSDKYDDVQETLIDWNIRKESLGGTLGELILEWTEEQTTASFDPNNCAIVHRDELEAPLYKNASLTKNDFNSMNKKNISTLGNFTLQSASNVASIAVSMYPNPVVNQLNIQVTDLAEEMEVELLIYSVSGAQTYRSVATLSTDQTLTIDAVKDLVPGSYILTINSSSNNKSLYTSKFTKK